MMMRLEMEDTEVFASIPGDDDDTASSDRTLPLQSPCSRTVDGRCSLSPSSLLTVAESDLMLPAPLISCQRPPSDGVTAGPGES